MSQFEVKQLIEHVGIDAAIVDHAGIIRELSAGWKAPGSVAASRRSSSLVGRSYFEACIRPDRHSLELLRGFNALVDGRVDLFATVHFREVGGEQHHFLILALPGPARSILILHIDLSKLLQGRGELSAMLIGYGAAAAMVLESAVLNAVRGAVAEALSGQGRSPKTAVTSASDQRLLDHLTRPQIELLSCLAGGLSNQQIARQRKMSINTVKSQVAALIQKLNVTNRTQAALFALRNGAALGIADRTGADPEVAPQRMWPSAGPKSGSVQLI